MDYDERVNRVYKKNITFFEFLYHKLENKIILDQFLPNLQIECLLVIPRFVV